MFGSAVVDVGLALCLVFLLLSVLCSALREGLEAWFKMRPVHLHRGVREMLDVSKPELIKAFYGHPQISSLYQGRYESGLMRTGAGWRAKLALFVIGKERAGTLAKSTPPAAAVAGTGSPAPATPDVHRLWPAGSDIRFRSNLPSYIPSKNFAVALTDILVRGKVGAAQAASMEPLTVQAIRDGAARLDSPYVARAVLNAFDGTGITVERGLSNLEDWFNSSMERVSSWYRRESQTILFLIGLSVAVLSNVDAIRIARTFYSDKGLRDAVVAEGTRVSNDSTALTRSIADTRKALDSLKLPIGWTDAEWEDCCSTTGTGFWQARFGWLQKGKFWEHLFGWLMTGVAVSFGAPFWFELLGKFVSIRAAIKPAEKTLPTKVSDVTSAVVQAAAPGGVVAPSPAAAAVPVAAGQPQSVAAPGAFVAHQWASDDDPDGGVI